MNTSWLKSTAAVLILCMSNLSLPARASVIDTESAISAQQVSAQTRQMRSEVSAFLARQDVRTQLTGWGVDPAQASERVATLSDEEVATLHGKIRQLPAGGDLIGALVFIFVLLLITDILGLTKVFPFTRHR